jgi:hypothetical protein
VAEYRIFQGGVFGHNLLRGITRVVVHYEHLRFREPSRAAGFHGVEQHAKLVASIASGNQNTDPYFDLLRELELTLPAANYPYPERIELLRRGACLPLDEP